ncbi:hypothetical protein CFOL_v3_35468, partial [Cephalotus follicularis]
SLCGHYFSHILSRFLLILHALETWESWLRTPRE